MIKFISILIFAATLNSCSTTQCKPEDLAAQKKPTNEKITKSIKPENYMKKIKVYKQDGSVQCEDVTGTSLEKMSVELSGLTIHQKEKKHDGLLRAQMCGNPTGQCNVFEINETDLIHVEKLGFKIWKND